MASERELSRCRDRLEGLSGASLDCESFRREVIACLRRTIGFDRWCWPLADPDTLVTSSGLAEHNYGPNVPRSLELEYSSDAFAAKPLLARRSRTAASIRSETGGDAARSARWDEVLRPAGIGDVAIVACRDDQGCWGWIELYRDSADASFEVVGHLAAAAFGADFLAQAFALAVELLELRFRLPPFRVDPQQLL